MSRTLERWEYLQREARQLQAKQSKAHPLSQEWMSLERQVMACFVAQAEG